MFCGPILRHVKVWCEDPLSSQSEAESRRIVASMRRRMTRYGWMTQSQFTDERCRFPSPTSRAASARNSTLSASFFTSPGHTMGSSGSSVSPRPRHRSARARRAFFATWGPDHARARAVVGPQTSVALIATQPQQNDLTRPSDTNTRTATRPTASSKYICRIFLLPLLLLLLQILLGVLYYYSMLLLPFGYRCQPLHRMSSAAATLYL